jgi:dihydroorotate dehydrogenase electron transfer subunit
MDKRITLKIAIIEDETKDIKTYTFNYRLDAQPGQFIMLTDFEGGEKPFSISDCTKDEFSITVKRIGEFTSRLFQKRVGDYVSIRGAFGSSFFVSKGKVLLIGGGYAVPTFYFFVKVLRENGAGVTLINGARTKDEHLFSEKFSELGIKVINTTDDGTFGEKGTSVDVAKRMLHNQRENGKMFDFVYASGPEMMMKTLQPLLHNVEYEFLFERYMKCAIGICGNCTMDPLGIRLCVEGPVLPKKLVVQLTEFGKYHRDASGKRIKY